MCFPSQNIFPENMLRFTATASVSSRFPTPISIHSVSKPRPIPPLISSPNLPSSTLKFQAQRNPRNCVVCAENGNGLSNDPKEEREKKGDDAYKNNNGGGGGEDDVKRNGRPAFSLRWVDLLLDPDPDNVIAVGLTGLLAWASVQVLWQLFFISVVIIVAALKYSFIAAVLIFILITLL